MEKRKLQRITRTRHLTPEEVANDREVRRKVQEEFPPAPRAVESISQSIAESLKQAIRDSGRSVYQISKDSGIAQIVIARFLSGERDIRMATADKLARSLKMQLTTG
jgi:hypothetical protein